MTKEGNDVRNLTVSKERGKDIDKAKRNFDKVGISYKEHKDGDVSKFEYEVDWDSKWQEVALSVHGYYGINAAWILDLHF